MPNVFISHKHEDMLVAQDVKKYLDKSLINAWLDDVDLQGGANLATTFITEIGKCDIFMPIISEKYIQSDWCLEELNIAYPKMVSKQLKVIPIVLGNPTSWETKQPPMVETLLTTTKYISFNPYDSQTSCTQIVEAINSQEAICFKPVKEWNGMVVIEIKVNIETLPTNFLQTWNFRINDFIANAEDENQPLTFKKPVAFTGRCPNWLLTFLIMPFVNKRDVYIYNNTTNDYICIYSLNNQNTGKVIPLA